MRAITSVDAIDDTRTNDVHVYVSELNRPGHPAEKWFVYRHGSVWKTVLVESGWTAETETLGSALAVCLVGVVEDGDEATRPTPEGDGLLLMDNGRAWPGYVEVQRDDEAETFEDDIEAAHSLCDLAGFPGEVYEQIAGLDEDSEGELRRYVPGAYAPDRVLCIVVPRHVAVSRYGEKNVPG